MDQKSNLLKGLKIKETYLLVLIVLGLFSLATYSTLALFTASTEIENVVDFSTTLQAEAHLIEYEMVTVPAGQTKVIEINVTNAHDGSLYYGAWYKIVAPTDKANVNIGLFSEENSTPGSGLIEEDGALHLVVGITNEDVTDALINIGVVGSIDNELNLGTTRFLIPAGWTRPVIVTDEYLEQHKETYTETTENAIDKSYTTAQAHTVTLNPGTYKLEVWGAQGGSFNSTYIGGYGGYSYGTLTLTSAVTAYVYVGGQGTNGTTSGTFAGGFNGGGQARSTNATYDMSAGGGGTDIRLGQDSLYARVIVAGGGGGAGTYSSSYRYSGGNGGGTSGSAGGQYSTSYKAGLGGGTTSAGTSYYGTTTNSTSYGTPAAFGTGGSGSSSYIAGGGGGWYGGGYARRASGGGGSGYVYTSSTASQYPSGCLLNSSYYLTDAATSTSSQIGNGKARISGTERIQTQKTGYTIPRVTGLTSLTIHKGTSVDLEENVTVECAYNDTECSLTKVSITNTSKLDKGNYIVYYTVTDGNGIKHKYARSLKVTNNLDFSGANEPELTENLIPVKYDETCNDNVGCWVTADSENGNKTYQWYDYDAKKWANAVLLTATKRDSLTKDSEGNYTPGQTIGDTESAGVLAFYVWIPRYKYKVWNKDKIIATDSYSAETKGIDIVFESGIETTGTITCTYSFAAPSSSAGSPNETCTGANEDYYTHPAFKFGDTNLEGIWVGKFEISSSTPTANYGGGESTTLIVRTLPNVNSWRWNPVTNFWKVIDNMQASSNIYGLSTDHAKVDSHMLTNMEWGAVAYLTHSKYGRCNGTSCTETAINSYYSPSPSTYKTGCGPQSSGSTSLGITCNAYTSTLGLTASTTGNIYGVYDMSGGAWEYVMGNMSSASGSYTYYASSGGSNFTYNTSNSKYITTYANGSGGNDQTAYNRGRLGDATSEVVKSASTGWYSDYTRFPYSSSSWFVRGGSYDDGTDAGVFYFNYRNGGANSYSSARSALAVFSA